MGPLLFYSGSFGLLNTILPYTHTRIHTYTYTVSQSFEFTDETEFDQHEAPEDASAEPYEPEPEEESESETPAINMSVPTPSFDPDGGMLIYKEDGFVNIVCVDESTHTAYNGTAEVRFTLDGQDPTGLSFNLYRYFMFFLLFLAFYSPLCAIRPGLVVIRTCMPIRACS